MTISSENVTLVSVVTFLSTFFILVAMIPSNLMTAASGKVVAVPEYFESVDVQSFAQLYNFTAAFGVQDPKYFYEYFTLGGWNMRYGMIKGYALTPDKLEISHYASWWVFKWEFHLFDFYDSRGYNHGDQLSPQELDSAWDGNSSLIMFNIQSDQAKMKMYIAYNQTEFTKPSEAFYDGTLWILVAIGFDQVNTSINAWNLIGAILFFQMPNVHWALNALISIPLWILIAWLIYILILKAIPFVGG